MQMGWPGTPPSLAVQRETGLEDSPLRMLSAPSFPTYRDAGGTSPSLLQEDPYQRQRPSTFIVSPAPVKAPPTLSDVPAQELTSLPFMGWGTGTMNDAVLLEKATELNKSSFSVVGRRRSSTAPPPSDSAGRRRRKTDGVSCGGSTPRPSAGASTRFPAGTASGLMGSKARTPGRRKSGDVALLSNAGGRRKLKLDTSANVSTGTCIRLVS